VRDLTEEELKWVSKEYIENCHCEEIECAICNTYMPDDIASELIDKRIASEVETSKKREENRLKELAILDKPESERTLEEKSFVTTRALFRKLEESQVKTIERWLSNVSFFDVAHKSEDSTVEFKRPSEHKK